MLIDLHCHTAVHSSCSSLQPAELVHLARSAGLDGVCLTEHDRSWAAKQVRALSRELDFPILRGMEITTELGHVLVFGLDDPAPGMFLAASLRKHVESVGGLMVLAHPARAGQPTVDLRVNDCLFDTIEGINGSDGPVQNLSATRLAALVTLPPVGGSDCHTPREVGTAATRLQRPVRTERELIDELRRGLHAAVDLKLPAAK